MVPPCGVVPKGRVSNSKTPTTPQAVGVSCCVLLKSRRYIPFGLEWTIILLDGRKLSVDVKASATLKKK
jgi:hypothetical protein